MPANDFLIAHFTTDLLHPAWINQHAAGGVDTGLTHFYDVRPVDPELGYCMFICRPGTSATAYVSVSLQQQLLRLGCDCSEAAGKLCSHQAQVLLYLSRKDDLLIFFDQHLRQERIRVVAKDYGLEQEPDLDIFFEVAYENRSLIIRPRSRELFKVDPESKRYLSAALLPAQKLPPLVSPEVQQILVFREHKYYHHFYVELYSCTLTAAGKVKQPLVLLQPMDFIWKAEDPEVLKFYSSVAKFQQHYDTERQEADVSALKALVKNPLQLRFFNQKEGAKQVGPLSLIPLQIHLLHLDIRLHVSQVKSFYEITGQLYLNDRSYSLEKLQVVFQYFLVANQILYLIENPYFLKLIDFFKKHNNKMLVHQTKFDEFQRSILSKLEDHIQVSYAFLKPATAAQLEENSFDQPNERLIYLADEGDHILITPVVRYGHVEVPVLSKKNIYAIDSHGKPFSVSRDDAFELRLIAILIRQHPHFEEQLEERHFYLHKSRFLDNGWFLEAFEQWKMEGITVLGFNELKNNKLSAHKAQVDIKVMSGLDWFETSVELKFGKEKIGLKHLHKAIRNKSKYVQLDDGTLGILPDEWIARFKQYFEAGELSDELIKTPKAHFSSIAEMYEEECLSAEVKLELASFQEKLNNFESMTQVQTPAALNGMLREYQLHGLNWLNFLDEFGFGGCLADDMGLGKTVQVIAYILLQQEKGMLQQPGLIVVPTTLISNWQQEMTRFAPSLRVQTLHGHSRPKDVLTFADHDVVLTSYGTLLHDIRFLKKYLFSTVFLDESQTVKNPSSQRYQAAAMLKSRNKIVLTGTPVENSTFDLYGQLSLANPGLLGNKQYFKDYYSTPIDKFKDIKRALELQKKVRPFILRRTKKQVAKELPDKTEMVLYCEMGDEQRKVYESYKEEYRNYLLNQSEEDLSMNNMHVLKGLTQLRQICNSPALVKADHFYGEASAKIATLMEEIEVKHTAHKILVFSQFVGMLDLIRTALESRNIGFEYLTGQTKDRAARVDAFQQQEKIRVFLISLKAGGTGLNLTEADYVYLVDPWWNPAVENQAIDRSYRIGQQKKVVAVRLICPDTIEEKMMRLQAAKKDLANDLIRTDQDHLKRFSRKELLELFN